MKLQPVTKKAKERAGTKHPVEAEVLQRQEAACFDGAVGLRIRFPNGHERWIREAGDTDFRVL